MQSSGTKNKPERFEVRKEKEKTVYSFNEGGGGFLKLILSFPLSKLAKKARELLFKRVEKVEKRKKRKKFKDYKKTDEELMEFV